MTAHGREPHDPGQLLANDGLRSGVAFGSAYLAPDGGWSEGNTGAMYLHFSTVSRADLFGRPSGQVGKQPEREPLDITRHASAPQRRRS
jgi:hypothetical protein